VGKGIVKAHSHLGAAQPPEDHSSHRFLKVHENSVNVREGNRRDGHLASRCMASCPE